MSSLIELSSSDESSNEEIILDIIIKIILVIMRLPKPRVVRERYNPLKNFDDHEFKCRFRLSKETFMVLLRVIEDKIEHQTCRNNAISPVNQLLIALRYYATGAFQVLLSTFNKKKIEPKVINEKLKYNSENLPEHFLKELSEKPIDQIVNFIEGNKATNEKRAVKKARRRKKKEEIERIKKEEEEAERKRIEEVLKKQEIEKLKREEALKKEKKKGKNLNKQQKQSQQQKQVTNSKSHQKTKQQVQQYTQPSKKKTRFKMISILINRNI